MPSIADVYVTILPETSKIGPGIKRALRSLDNDFYQAGKRWGNEIDRGLGNKRDLLVDANTANAQRKVRELERELEKMQGGPGARGKRTVKVDVDKSAFSTAATALRNVQTNFTALAVAGAAVPNTVANVSASIAQLSGVAGLLPATIGAAALTIGSLKVATLGFGDAMKNVRDVEKFNESLKTLSPNAQEAARSIQGLLPEIDRLKYTVQDAFFAGLGQQMQQLSTTYLPMFQTAMSQVAASANTAMQTVGNMLQQPAMAGDVQGMLGNTTSAINILSQALAPVVKSFVDIGLVGSGFLPQLATAATQAASAFAVFIDNARQSGDLQKWIQGGIDAMSTLGRIAGDIFNIFMKFSGMQTPGGGLLGMIEGITSTVSDFVSSPAGSGALQTFITTMGTTVQAILPVLGQLLQTLTPVLATLGGGLAMVIQAVAPALQQWLQAMQPVVDQLISAFLPVMQALQPVLADVAMMLANQMVSGIQQILPVLMPFVQQMGELVAAVLPLVPPLAQLALSFMPAFQQAVATILPVLTTFAALLTDQANFVMPGMIAVIDQMSAQVQFLGQVFEGPLVRAILGAVGVIKPVLSDLKQLIDQIADGPLGKILGMAAGPLPHLLSALPGGGGGGGSGNRGPNIVQGGPPGSPSTTPGILNTPGQIVPKGTPGAVIKPGTNTYWIPPPSGSVPTSAIDKTHTLPAAGLPGGPPPPAAPIPPVSSYVAPPPAATKSGGGGTTPSAAIPPSTAEAFWDAIAKPESTSQWDNPNSGGHEGRPAGGLQIKTGTWNDYGGTEFAPTADLATRQEQMIVADRIAFTGYKGRSPQGLGAWQAVAEGKVPGITVNSPRPAGSTGAATSAGSTSAATSSSVPVDARTFAHETMIPFWQSQGLTAGDHAADQYGEHQQGALDVMVPDIATGQQVLQQALTDPNVYGAIFNRKSYGYGHGAQGQDYTGSNPHTDHVHILYNPGPGATGPGTGTGSGVSSTASYDSSGLGLSDYSGGYSSSKSVREAQEKVADTNQRIADEEAKLKEMQFKSGVSQEDLARQQDKIAKAKREHADAQADLNDAMSKGNDLTKQGAGGGIGENLGKDIVTGMMEVFGFGDVFKDPTQFGLFKLFKGVMGLKPAGGDGASLDTAAATNAGGGGGGMLDSFLSIVPQPFGKLNTGRPGDAPGQFMPTMPGATDASVSPFGVTGAPGTAGPGNAPIDNSININNPIGQDGLMKSFQTAQAEQYPRMRQPLRQVPTG